MFIFIPALHHINAQSPLNTNTSRLLTITDMTLLWNSICQQRCQFVFCLSNECLLIDRNSNGMSILLPLYDFANLL